MFENMIAVDNLIFRYCLEDTESLTGTTLKMPGG